MKDFYKTVLAGVATIAICSNVAMLYQFGERLARIEARIDMLAQNPHISQK